MNTASKKPLPAWLPLVVGGLLVVQFAGLGVWQISRGLEKAAAREAFAERGTAAQVSDGMTIRPYQPLKATGRFDSSRQFLLDNIILDSRYGYYVVTPFELDGDAPLLLVNRGWIEKTALEPDLEELKAAIRIDGDRVTVRGRAGSLPRPGMRMGDAITAQGGWPKIAVYPATVDVEKALGRAVQPFVLLMDPDDEDGFLRRWVPQEMGPGRHYGYALQWFAMGAALLGLLIWHGRRRGFSND